MPAFAAPLCVAAGTGAPEVVSESGLTELVTVEETSELITVPLTTESGVVDTVVPPVT
jgi:hypothetical protein